MAFEKLKSFRRKPTTTNTPQVNPYPQQVNPYPRDPQPSLHREIILQESVRKLEQELYTKRQEEERQALNLLKQQQDEAYKQKQLKMQIQEADNCRQEQLRKTTPEALRHMQDLIRTRHELDLAIWRDRKTNQHNRDVLILSMMKADEILNEIYAIADSWEESGGWDAEEWKYARRIKQNLAGGRQRVWLEDPPWNDPDA